MSFPLAGGLRLHQKNNLHRQLSVVAVPKGKKPRGAGPCFRVDIGIMDVKITKEELQEALAAPEYAEILPALDLVKKTRKSDLAKFVDANFDFFITPVECDKGSGKRAVSADSTSDGGESDSTISFPSDGDEVAPRTKGKKQEKPKKTSAKKENKKNKEKKN